MGVPVVIRPDGAPDWVADDEFLTQFDRADPGASMGWITRWRDFVNAGLHVASATDAPWTFPNFELIENMGRPVDQIAAGRA